MPRVNALTRRRRIVLVDGIDVKIFLLNHKRSFAALFSQLAAGF
jgi:hypothetical protein